MRARWRRFRSGDALPAASETAASTASPRIRSKPMGANCRPNDANTTAREGIARRRLKALLHTWLGAYYAGLLRERGVTHIHAHHGYFGSWIAMTAARLLGVSFSLTLHGSDLLRDGVYLETKLKNCRFCVTISEYNRPATFWSISRQSTLARSWSRAWELMRRSMLDLDTGFLAALTHSLCWPLGACMRSKITHSWFALALGCAIRASTPNA